MNGQEQHGAINRGKNKHQSKRKQRKRRKRVREKVKFKMGYVKSEDKRYDKCKVWHYEWYGKKTWSPSWRHGKENHI